ncbi:hypothetical protein PYCC9005_005654 [Savitreella phatthalungensis]
MSLPSIPNVTRLAPNVIRILGQNGPSQFVLQGTNTYLIGTGNERILLDTAEGHDEYVSLLKEVLEDEKCTISTILLSHWHHDHVEGLPSVRQLLKDLGHQQPIRVLKFPHETDEQDWEHLKDGEVVEVQGASMKAVHTPGHTVDHLAFMLGSASSTDSILFTADHILGGSTSIFEDLGVYMASLRKVQALKPGKLFPGHGEVMEQGTRIIDHYITHRQAREDQIVHTLAEETDGKAITSMGIVKIVYKDVREDLHLAAERGVIQHLDKLISEGRVEKRGEAYVLLAGAAGDATSSSTSQNKSKSSGKI